MASIINATTTNGVVASGDNSGALQLATNNGTTAVTIDTSQNVGIGRAPGAARLDLEAASGQTKIILRNVGNTSDSNTFIAAETGSVGDWANLTLAARHALRFVNNSVENMRIDSSGYVTTPYQPAFHAVRNAGNVSSTGIFICNAVTFNDGSHYNSSTGRFTAPVAGRYQMNFFVLGQVGNSVDFSIRVNGTQYAGMDIRNNTGTSGNFTLSCSAIFKLSANDIVDPYISSLASGPIYGQGLNAFSMYFLG